MNSILNYHNFDNWILKFQGDKQFLRAVVKPVNELILLNVKWRSIYLYFLFLGRREGCADERLKNINLNSVQEHCWSICEVIFKKRLRFWQAVEK